MNGKGLAARIYFAVRREPKTLFRATKIPRIILLIGFVGVPGAASLYLTTYAARNHSALPLHLLVVGFLQFRMENDSSTAYNLPPNLAQLLHTMTPKQKQQGKEMFEYFSVLVMFLTFATVWWVMGALRFVAIRTKHEMP